MIYRKFGLPILVTLSLGLGSIGGCTDGSAPSTAANSDAQSFGRVNFAIALPVSSRSVSALVDVLDHLDITLTGGNLTSPRSLTITKSQIVNGSASANFDRVPAGSSVLGVAVKDAASNVLASGSANVTIIAGREATANLTLSVPTDGSVSSTITLVEATPTPVPTALPATASVNIQGMQFGPSSIDIAQGGTVTFYNKDSMPHTVSPTGGAQFTGSGNIPAGSQATVTFNTTGTQTYACDYHPSMVGSVNVH